LRWSTLLPANFCHKQAKHDWGRLTCRWTPSWTDINRPTCMTSVFVLGFFDPWSSGSIVQWHYLDKLSNDTVPNHILFTTNYHQAIFIYNRTKIAGGFPVLSLKNVLILYLWFKLIKFQFACHRLINICYLKLKYGWNKSSFKTTIGPNRTTNVSLVVTGNNNKDTRPILWNHNYTLINTINTK